MKMRSSKAGGGALPLPRVNATGAGAGVLAANGALILRVCVPRRAREAAAEKPPTQT